MGGVRRAEGHKQHHTHTHVCRHTSLLVNKRTHPTGRPTAPPLPIATPLPAHHPSPQTFQELTSLPHWRDVCCLYVKACVCVCVILSDLLAVKLDFRLGFFNLRDKCEEWTLRWMGVVCVWRGGQLTTVTRPPTPSE